MKRRIISCILAMLVLLSCAPSLTHVAAAEAVKKAITIDARGKEYALTVYEDSDGTIYVPVTMLSQFGGMTCKTSDSQYTFYYKNEADRYGSPLAGARRIIIEKSSKSVKVVCYTSSSKSSTIESFSFSKTLIIDNKLYLPIAECLPLLDAKVEITSDGIVHIYKNPVPLYRALFGHKLDICTFDKDDILFDELITATGLIVDTIFGRLDRLDFLTNAGAIKDYSNLYKTLLTDNTTYLSAFDHKETPLDKAMGLIADSAGDLDDAIGGTKKVLSMAKYMSTSSLHETYKAFSDDIEKFNSNTSFIEAAIKITEYADVYYNQVDDHRDMLMAVYGGSSSSAAIAANEIYTLYGNDIAEKATSAATSALRNYISGEMTGAITKGITPYKIAFSAVKLAIPDAAKEFSIAAQLYYLDKVIDDAYDVSTQRLSNMKHDEKSLENLRLSLIMTLVASKHGYETFYGSDCDELTIINDWLEQLYLASDSVACVAKGYYANKKAELNKNIKYIKFADTSNPGSSTDPDEPTAPPDSNEPTRPTDSSIPSENGSIDEDNPSGLITVPDLVGMEQVAAVYLLQDMGLQFQVWWIPGDNVEWPLYIVAQSIPAGTEVVPGTLITLQISGSAHAQSSMHRQINTLSICSTTIDMLI